MASTEEEERATNLCSFRTSIKPGKGEDTRDEVEGMSCNFSRRL